MYKNIFVIVKLKYYKRIFLTRLNYFLRFKKSIFNFLYHFKGRRERYREINKNIKLITECKRRLLCRKNTEILIINYLDRACLCAALSKACFHRVLYRRITDF